MPWTNYGKAREMDCYVGGGTKPATVYAALSTTTCNASGTNVTEPSTSGTAYARVAITNNATNFPNTTDATGVKTNGTAITWPQATASWGAIVCVVFYDSATVGAGNALFYGTTSKTIDNLDTPSIAAGALTLTGTTS